MQVVCMHKLSFFQTNITNTSLPLTNFTIASSCWVLIGSSLETLLLPCEQPSGLSYPWGRSKVDGKQCYHNQLFVYVHMRIISMYGMRQPDRPARVIHGWLFGLAGPAWAAVDKAYTARHSCTTWWDLIGPQSWLWSHIGVTPDRNGLCHF